MQTARRKRRMTTTMMRERRGEARRCAGATYFATRSSGQMLGPLQFAPIDTHCALLCRVVLAVVLQMRAKMRCAVTVDS
jgi:hypothetical protein